MAQWQLKIDMSDDFRKYPDEITIQELSAKFADELKRIRPDVKQEYGDYLEQLESIIDDFETLKGIKEADADDFDQVLEDLYDWGDEKLDDKFNGKRLCWIGH